MVGIVMWLALVAGGEAPKPAARAEAKQRLQAGNKRYQSGDYEGALREFEAAFALVPSPKIRFNIGQAYAGLARPVEALTAFETFLAEPSDAPAEMRREAERYVGELGARVATLTVACETEGAEVSIDGRPVGRTPLERPVRLAPGAHQLVVTGAAGATPFIERIEAKPGEVTTVTAKLASKTPPAAPPAALMPAPAAMPAVAVTKTAAPAPTGRRHTWLWIGAGVLVAGGIAAAFMLRDPGHELCGEVKPCVAVH